MSLNNFSFSIQGNLCLADGRTPIALTAGNFDGVHVGHRYLLDCLHKNATGLPIVVLTFHPHPTDLLHPEACKPLLTPPSLRNSFLLEAGADAVVTVAFTKEFASLSPEDFCLWLSQRFQIHTLMLGHDFRYGFNRSGDFSHMHKFASQAGWNLLQCPEFLLQDQMKVSSSLIRQELSLGKIREAAKFLGRPHVLKGKVIRGDRRGRSIGFPTANLSPDYTPVIPAYGVYACRVELSEDGVLLPAVMNCGIRPTIAEGLKLQVEAHILDFSKDIYGYDVLFHVIDFIRGEMKFDNLELLRRQIEQDAITATKILAGSRNEQTYMEAESRENA